MKQADLFPSPLAEGFAYQDDFLSAGEERDLLQIIETLPLREAQYKEFIARRRTVSYGSSYDFANNASLAAPPIPEFLYTLRDRVAAWARVHAESFAQALIAEYRPGAPLGWHRDVPEFELIAGISLLNPCRMRFRPYPWTPARRKEMFSLDLAPRSAYILRGAARWGWQHSIPAVEQLRYSITLRTRRNGTEVGERR